MSNDLLRLLMFGVASDELQNFLLHDLTEKVRECVRGDVTCASLTRRLDVTKWCVCTCVVVLSTGLEEAWPLDRDVILEHPEAGAQAPAGRRSGATLPPE